MRVAVLGAGALGSLYGAWSAEAGHDVVLVGRQRHVDVIGRHGLQVGDRRGGSRTVAIGASALVESAADADVVLVASKAQDTPALLDAYRGEPRAAWSVQNGARQADPLVARFGAAAIGGTSMVGATLDRPGVVTNTFTGATYVGPLPTSDTAAATTVRLSLGHAVDVVERDDIVDVLWSKAVLAAGAMGLSVLLRLPYHHVFVEPGARNVFYDVLREAADVATAEGASLVDLPGPLQAGSLMSAGRGIALARLAEVGRHMVAAGQTSVRVSMLQSLESGRRMEVDAVFGDLVASADRHGLAVPLLRAVTDIVRTLDETVTA